MSEGKAQGESIGPESSTQARGTTAAGKKNEERTGEENRERSYVAASHRGDRTIEARMESAEKASELHEQRTGKPLEITREAVEREENYAEVEPGQQKKQSKAKSTTTTKKQAKGSKASGGGKQGKSGPRKEGAGVDIAVGEEDLGEEDEGAPFDDQEEDEGDVIEEGDVEEAAGELQDLK